MSESDILITSLVLASSSTIRRLNIAKMLLDLTWKAKMTGRTLTNLTLGYDANPLKFHELKNNRQTEASASVV